MKKIVIIIFTVLLTLYIYNSFFLGRMLIGTYTNKNYKNSPIGPNIPDTIVLLENDKFIGSYFGNGKYHITYSLTSTYISLDYDDAIETDFETSISRGWFGKPKIHFFRDIGHCYEKINN